MIADALLTASVFAFIFAIADVLLSDGQKRRMEVLIAQLWSKLDDYKSYSLWPIFRSRRFRTALFLAGSIAPLVEMAVAPGSSDVRTLPITFNDVFVVLVVGSLSSAVAILSLAWITSASKQSTAVTRAVLALGIFIPVSFYCMLYLFDSLLSMTLRPMPTDRYYPDYGVGGLGMIVLMFLSILSMIIVMALPIAVVQLLRISILIGEFVLRRIAEYPKGAILAGSAIATAAIGLFKALS